MTTAHDRIGVNAAVAAVLEPLGIGVLDRAIVATAAAALSGTAGHGLGAAPPTVDP
jgi:hypothetical protein